MFHHHLINDTVRAVAGDQAYLDTHANFAADHGATVPDLPAGAIERIYESGIRHAISNGRAIIAGGSQPWAFGDAAIAKVTGLLSAQAKRNTPPPKAPMPAPQPSKTGKSSGTATVAS
ncbi:MAG TPA: hypothetical protein VJS41_07480 [Stellaceae bacterium]|nr:hypothetical protein [Stellaceae bacterium]